MAKRVDPLKAKEAKQKKMAIGLCVLLVAILAFQGPKTLKMLKGPQAAASTAAPAPVGDPIGGAVVTPPDAAQAAGGPLTGTEQPAVLADSDVPAAAGDGQLRSFELFQAKDPFAQQNGGITTVPGSSPAPAQEPSSPAEPAPASGGSVIAPPAGASDSDDSDGTVTPPPPATTPPAAATAASTAASTAGATSIAVNGVAADVAIDASFPAAAPAFVLVSLAKDGKSAQIGVAGGVYANGVATVKLTLGKPLTLQNTADGTRYELELLSVAGFVPPKPGK